MEFYLTKTANWVRALHPCEAQRFPAEQSHHLQQISASSLGIRSRRGHSEDTQQTGFVLSQQHVLGFRKALYGCRDVQVHQIQVIFHPERNEPSSEKIILSFCDSVSRIPAFASAP